MLSHIADSEISAAAQTGLTQPVPCLLMNQFFHPDGAATSQLLTDLARFLPQMGHSVRVICGANRYAAGGATEPPPVRIHRCMNFAFSRSLFGRTASYTSFLLGAIWYGFRAPRDATVLTLTTPPVLSLIGSLLRATRGARHFIWEMDLYPDIAVDLGVLSPHSWLTRLTAWALDYARHRAAGIIVLGEDMKDRLAARGIAPEKIWVCENWADGREITPQPFPKGPLTILYSGNLGLAHEVETIRGVMLALGNDPNFRFIFAGGGARREDLQSFCREQSIRNVIFKPYCLREELDSSLAEAHLGLITQLPASLGSIVPSKTYGLMAAGRPLLYIGPESATPARVAYDFRCGWQIAPGDSEGCVALLRYLAGNPEALQSAGARARESFDIHYDRAVGVARIAAVLGLSLPHVNSAIT